MATEPRKQQQGPRRSLAVGMAMLAVVAFPLVGGSEPAGAADPVLEEELTGTEVLAEEPEAVAEIANLNDLSVRSTRRILADPTSRVITSGAIYWVDPAVPEYSSAPPERGPFPYSETFTLHSRPGSTRTIYLDFNGHRLSDTAWPADNLGPYTALAYDTDGSATFSNAELDAIQQVWLRVAENFSPFDIDVTTQDPGLAAIDRSSATDAVYGTRVVVTHSPDTDFGDGGAAGLAFLGGFDSTAPSHAHATLQPVMVFDDSFGLNVKMAATVNHEVGHSLGLSHDGELAHDGQAARGYYTGHGLWRPVMGTGRDRPVVQWSRGDYAFADNPEDDLAVIASHGAVPRADDHTNAFATATNLVSSASGVITPGASRDFDLFRYVATSTDDVTFTVEPSADWAVLDTVLTLYSASGTQLATNSPPAALVDANTASGRNATITAALTAGTTYFVQVGPTGFLTPATGYTSYGSLGTYTLAVEVFAGNGVLSGTVTQAGAGTPVAGAWVAALRTTDFTIAGGAVANGSGNYAMTLPSGSYVLYLIDPADTRTTGFFGAPTTVTVTRDATTDVDPQMSSSRGSITSVVTESGSGAPISGAWGLSLSAAPANTGATEVAAIGNASGRVTLPGLRPGNHFVGFIDPTGAHSTRFFPAASDLGASTPVGVTAANTTTANAALPVQTPVGTGSVISGTIISWPANTPLASAYVVALRASDFRMVRGAVTNAAGQYSLNLASGGYKLAFLDSSGLHTMEWYNAQPATGLADALTVNAPGSANAFLLSSTGKMRGTLTDSVTGAPLAGAWVVAIGPGGFAGGAVTAADGTYTVTGLAPGTYRATFVDPNGGRAQEYFHNSPDLAGSTPFPIGAASVTTVNAALAPPAP